MALSLHCAAHMQTFCDELRSNLTVVLARWETLARQQPWFALPPADRRGELEAVVLGIVEAGLCEPTNEETHRRSVDASARHGASRRAQGVPETMLSTEYHLIRQALWGHLCERFPDDHRATTEAIFRIDAVILPANNACMWGYYRTEVEALGKWEIAMNRLVAEAPRREG